ncbi:MAG: response regulator [Planctomycetota bacterium]|nr:response regulator [Planctomycetota bacterium]
MDLNEVLEVKAREKRLDLVMLQARKNDRRAFQLCRNLKSSPDLPYSPVMLILANRSPEWQAFAYKSGANDVVAPPFVPSMLPYRVGALLKYRFAVTELEAARIEMEERVNQRTLELSHAVERLKREIEERKRTEQALISTQEQLHQAQKMEALGRLAGGLAHDFNNLLTTIQGYGHILERELGEAHPGLPRVATIKKAADRAHGLTKQLLAFGRRQVLHPVVLDLNQSVLEAKRFIGQIVTEEIETTLELQERLGRVRVDPVQIIQVLLNLAANARDAMPAGGRLSISTRNAYVAATQSRNEQILAKGHYVKLTVRDTGCGMPPAVKARVFEPFFTTKEVGKGTGLGLSTVYGIVQQSGGFIHFDSAPGTGTVFDILFPRSEGEVAGAEDALPEAQHVAGHETVLVVEDEQEVRELVREGLQELGYKVLHASNGQDALERFGHVAKDIDFLVSDVVMPKLGGYDLLDRMRRINPRLKALLMSGYADKAVHTNGRTPEGVGFLEKPFVLLVLADRLRSLLDGKPVSVFPSAPPPPLSSKEGRTTYLT